METVNYGGRGYAEDVVGGAIARADAMKRFVRHAGDPPPKNFAEQRLEEMEAEKAKIAGARKDDQGKPPIFRGVLNYFPRALAAVAEVSDLGAKKYAWGGWRGVKDGFNRYTDGLGRHLLGEAIRERDTETGLLEAAHAAWNALARLELKLTEMEGKGQ